MPYSHMSDDQLEAVLEAQLTFQKIPGVTLVDVEYVDRKKTQPSITVYIDSRHRHEIIGLPTSVAGVPVIVKVEEPPSHGVVEIIDPRTNNGAWPAS